jgi:phosphatase NudJ
MRRIAVRAIIIYKDKLLLVKLRAYGGNPENDFYCTIGGGLDDGEGLIEGLKREVFEETGVKAEVGKLLYIQQFDDARFGKDDNIEFFFHVTNSNDFMNLDLSKSSHGEKEIKEIGFRIPAETTILPKFLTGIDINSIGTEQQVLLFNNLAKRI